MSPGVALALSVLLLGGNAFFVGASFAVMAARRSRLEPLAVAGRRRARWALQALDRVALLLACAQLGITVCSVLLGALAENAVHHLVSPLAERAGAPAAASHGIGLAAALLIVGYFHVLVGEILPKNLAIAGPERAALALAPPLLFLTRALAPLIRVVIGAAKFLVRRCGVEPRDNVASAFTAQEFDALVAVSAREGLLEEAERRLARRALEFSDRVAADVAVPFSELVTLPYGCSAGDVEQVVAKHGFSRVPLVDESGPLRGYVHLKDVLDVRDAARDRPLSPGRIRRLATVRPQDEVEDVLARMQHTGAHLARVVGVDGEPCRVVFLEDVLEELVGEVTDATQR